MAVSYAIFKHGSPVMVDYTPGADVAAGDVIVINDSVRIAHRDIPSGTLGALAAFGGVYQFPRVAATAIGDGVRVYWDATAHKVTNTAAAGANKQIGFTVGASLSADTVQRVFHSPA